MRSARAPLFVVVGTVLLACANPAAQTFRSAVNLVVVPVTVNDPAGQFVGNLTQGDFTVFEDGAERPIADFSAERMPVSLGTLIDISGSMAGARFRDAQQAMEKLTERLTSDDRVFLATFNQQFALVTPWTKDRQSLIRALAGVRPSGGTFLYRALSSAIPLLDSETSRKKALVLISDGDDNERAGGAVNREGLARVVAQAKASDAVIYAVAIGRPKPSDDELIKQLADQQARRRLIYDPPIDVDQLRRLTDPTGGYTQLIPTSATLSANVIRIVDDVSQQYILGFEPARLPDGKPHTLKVTTRDGRLKVRSRTEYVATPARP
jgi:Ca-activated chloride channel homolog